MAQRFDENRDLLQIQVGELENQIRELMGAMQIRDQRIVDLEAHAAHQQIAAQEAGNLAAAQVGQQQHPVESALRALQTPQIIRILPPFDGNPIKLHSFIRSIDELMPEIERVRGTPAYTVWLLAIRSKIIGDADCVLEFYGTGSDWDEIKTNLITHYSDKRDEVTLTKDLFKLTQNDKKVEDFFKDIQFALSLMINQLNINEPNVDVRTAKNQFYQDMGLKVFLAGLNEPIGTVIRAQCPTSLKDALRRCLEERNFQLNKPKPAPPAIPPRNRYPNRDFNPFLQGFQSHPLPYPPMPYPPNPAQRNTPAHFNNFNRAQQHLQNHPPPQRALPPSNLSRAQQPSTSNPFQRPPLGAVPNNSNRPNSAQHRFPRPTPMEVDQSVMSRQINYMGRPHWHEMHWTEPMQFYGDFSYDPYYYQYDQSYDEVEPKDTQSTEQSGTSEPELDSINFQTESQNTANT